MRVAYTKSEMAQAVALAAVIGADAATEQLGCDPRSIRKWAAKAGHGPELAVEPDAWHNLMNLALARVSAQVASGTMKVRDMAVVALLDWFDAGDAAAPAPSLAESLAYVVALGDLEGWWKRRQADTTAAMRRPGTTRAAGPTSSSPARSASWLSCASHPAAS